MLTHQVCPLDHLQTFLHWVYCSHSIVCFFGVLFGKYIGFDHEIFSEYYLYIFFSMAPNPQKHVYGVPQKNTVAKRLFLRREAP